MSMTSFTESGNYREFWALENYPGTNIKGYVERNSFGNAQVQKKNNFGFPESGPSFYPMRDKNNHF